MTYLELCQKMIRDLGLSNSITTVAGQSGMNKKIVDWIADADEQIQALWADWKFLWKQHSDPTVATQREYTKPSDIGTWDLESFYLDYTTTDYLKLNYIDYPIWRKTNRQSTQTNDQPTAFCLIPSGNIYLHPIPDDVYALTADYWAAPTRLSDNTDTSPIPDRFERVIIAQAKIFYAEHDEFPAVYELASQEYARLLKQLQAAELPGKRQALTKSENPDIDLRIVVE